MEIVAHQLPEHLGDAVEGRGPLQGLVGGVVMGRVHPEGRYGAGNDHPFQPRVGGSLQDVEQSVDIDPVRQRAVGLGGHREQGAQMV